MYKTEKDLRFGPVELSDEQLEARRKDDMVDLPKKSKGKPKKKLKAELIADLLPTDVGKLHVEIGLKKKVLTELQEICTKLGINIQKTETQRKRLGWEGQGKGLFQVLAERGWIDLSNIKKYKMVATDSDGNIVPEYSLTHLMGRCTDFANEKSQLEYVCEKLGARAVTTTKYHAEYAGEGVEYSWGFAKAIYRRYPLKSKKTKEHFVTLVRNCISRKVLTKEIVQKFSARARGYMVRYKILEKCG